MRDEFRNTSHATRANFAETHWTLVLDAAREQSPDARHALEQLCQSYWLPLYAFVRRRGHLPADAKDLTQGFFADLLARNALQSLHPAQGRFRTFLLVCLENFLHNQHDKSQAQKRGGDVNFISIDQLAAEERYRLLPATMLDPAKVLDRVWANTVIARVLQQLQAQQTTDVKAGNFAALLPFLTGDASRGDYSGVAARLKLTEAAARKAAHDLRAEFRRLLIREIRRTVDSTTDVEAEIRQLFSLFEK